MWHTYLRHIEKHCRMFTHTHTLSALPFCTTNFHIPHVLPTFSFNGFGRGGSFLYQKPVTSILICWHEFTAHCMLTALRQNCKVQLTRERKIVQQLQVLRILWSIGIALSRQTGAAGSSSSSWWQPQQEAVKLQSNKNVCVTVLCKHNNCLVWVRKTN